jgi:hypothetical protein
VTLISDAMEDSMALSFRWPAGRSTAAALAGLVTAGFVMPFAVTPSARADGESRLGCGTYCQAAGPLAGSIGPGREAVTILASGIVTLDADGYLPVTLTCNLSVQCTGVLSSGIPGMAFVARSDLLVNPGATATLGLRYPAAAVADIQAHSPPCRSSSTDSCPESVGVLANVGPSFGCEVAMPNVGLPPCHWPINGFSPLSTAQLRVVAR